MIADLEVKPGDKIWPKWQLLLDWISRQKHQCPNASITYTPSGARIICEPDPIYQKINFEVSLEGDNVQIGDGTINGIVPTIKNIPITGGVNPPSPPPKLKLIPPDQNGVVFICIKTTHKKTGDLESATIVPMLQSNIPGALRADFSAGINGYIPIALVRHHPQTRQPISVHQHSCHNLQCRAYKSGNTTRIVYWAA